MLLSIPSPGQGVWHLGPLPIRAYALFMILGFVAAIWLSERRWAARGGKKGQITDAALVAIPFGIVGARIYHVISDHDLYFGAGRNFWDVFLIWHGGLSVLGAIPAGVLGGWLYARRKKLPFVMGLDVVAPTILVAQAIGRWGNYFNQELYGGTTNLPWKLAIDRDSAGNSVPVTYHHPTFLYESLWDLGMFGIVIWLERKLKLAGGRTFALYVMAWTAGRFWIENLRVDTGAHAELILGMRQNAWIVLIAFVVALAYFVWAGRRQASASQAEEPVGESEETSASDLG